jgi:hypothetical protein
MEIPCKEGKSKFIRKYHVAEIRGVSGGWQAVLSLPNGGFVRSEIVAVFRDAKKILQKLRNDYYPEIAVQPHLTYKCQECKRTLSRNIYIGGFSAAGKDCADCRTLRKGRQPITLKTRFTVFTKDNFTCQYCGRSAPKVELVLDHKIPVSKGGDNSISNLTTSCVDCNAGKSDFLIEDLAFVLPDEEKEDAA